MGVCLIRAAEKIYPLGVAANYAPPLGKEHNQAVTNKCALGKNPDP